MLAPDIMLATVLESVVDSKSIYLPGGSGWMDALNGTKYKGYRTINFEVILEIIPVFTRNGIDFKL